MIRNKKGLIKKLFKIGEDKIKQGLLFKELAFVIERNEEKKTFKEWFKFVQSSKVLKGGLENNGF